MENDFHEVTLQENRENENIERGNESLSLSQEEDNQDEEIMEEEMPEEELPLEEEIPIDEEEAEDSNDDENADPKATNKQGNKKKTNDEGLIPLAQVNRLMKKHFHKRPISKNGAVSFQRALSVFLCFLGNSAEEIVKKKKKKTITPVEMREALQAMDFADFI